MNKFLKYSLIVLITITCFACSKDEPSTSNSYVPRPVSLDIPEVFQDLILPPVIPTNNPMTEEGIALGKKLFFDKKLSADNSQSCATCHAPHKAFTNNLQFTLV